MVGWGRHARGDSEAWGDARCTETAEPLGFADRVEVLKSGREDDFQALFWNTAGKMESPFTGTGRTAGEAVGRRGPFPASLSCGGWGVFWRH